MEAGASASSPFVAIGDLLIGLHARAYDIHMLFFAIGAITWYVLMFQSRCVPRWLSSFGAVTAALALLSTILLLAADVDAFILAVPTGLFELTIGIWLLVKGVPDTEPITA